jgi:hypothetical protein
MSDVWILAALAAVLAAGLFLLNSRRREAPVAFADAREEALTLKLAALVRCTPAEALPAVRKELELGPNQTDETILKRAAYHYRQALPEKSSCQVFRDRAPG